MSRPTIQPNDRFGKLIVLHQQKSDKWGAAMYYCRCSCGKSVTVRGCHLRSGNTTSCGCARVDMMNKING